VSVQGMAFPHLGSGLHRSARTSHCRGSPCHGRVCKPAAAPARRVVLPAASTRLLATTVFRLRDARLWYDAGVIQICQVATLCDDGDGIAMETACTWRQRPEPPILTRRLSAECTAAAGGILHFLDIGAPVLGRRPGPPPGWNRVASFDLESDEWKAMIDGPPVGYPNEDEWLPVPSAKRRGPL